MAPPTVHAWGARMVASAAASVTGPAHGLLSRLWLRGAQRHGPASARSGHAAAAATVTAAPPSLGVASAAGPGGEAPRPAAAAATLEGRPIPGLQLAGLQLMEQRLRIGGRDFTLVMPVDVDAVIDLYLDAGLNDADPYWTRAWPSSVALAACLLARPELVRGKRVADVGSGLGLAGMAAAMAGAREVVLLDREPLALHCALLSAAASGLLDGRGVGSLQPEPLEGWGSSRSSDSSSSSSTTGTGGTGIIASGAGEGLPGEGGVTAVSGGGGSGGAEGTGASEGAAAVRVAVRSILSAVEAAAGVATAGDGGSGGGEQSQGAAAGPSHVQNTRVSAEDLQRHHPALLQRLQQGSSSNSSSSGALDAASVSQASGAQYSSIAGSTTPSGTLLAGEGPQASSGHAAQPSDGGSLRAASSSSPRVRARTFDWSRSELLGEQYEVLLACDVLYEGDAVEPIAELVPRLLSPQPGARLLLADPPTRTAHNRERFLRLLQEQQEQASAGKAAIRLQVEECSLHSCAAQQLDLEMVGGLGAANAASGRTIPIQLMLLRHTLGGDTVGLKALWQEGWQDA